MTLKTLIETHPADTPAGRTLRRIVESQLLPPDAELDLPSAADQPTPEAGDVVNAALRALLKSLLSAADVVASAARLQPVLESLASPPGQRLTELERENRRLQARERVRADFETAGLSPTEALVTAVSALESAADREAVLQSLTISRVTPARSGEPLLDSSLDRFERPNGKAFAQSARAG